ncbi:MAG: Hsp70 family protein [Lachnospiraceae bacterium]|nr:Hsp70 family protein [Lachnospiraceae bacterium]
MAVIGIDLGTTNSLGAYWKDGGVHLIPMEEEQFLLPSVVSHAEGEGFLVGAAAKERLIPHAEDTAASFKRFMGTAKEYHLGGRTYTPMELSAMVLEQIKRNAEFFLKEEIEEAVITVPAYFNDKQRSDTKKAAQIAGLKAERLINEPSAAALAYRMEYGEEDRTLLIFDFGGGTLDLSYVECFDNVIEIIAVAGDNHLGGDDIDQAVSDYFCRENGIRPEELSREEQAKLKKLSEHAKCALAQQEEVTMELELAAGRAERDAESMEPAAGTAERATESMERAAGTKVCRASLDSDRLFEICMPLFGKIKQLFLHILEDAGSRVSAIDDLVMVGGSSRLGVVKRFLRELLGKEPVVLGETDRVVAYGAGVYAGIRQRREEIRDMLLTDVCPFTLGIGVNNRANWDKNILRPMIERNSTLPASHRDRFVTVADYQKEIKVCIYQGEEYYVDDDALLGELTIEVALKPAGQAWVEVQFTYDINGILHVVVENEMGERRQILLANQTLSEAELERYTREMEKIMLPPIQQPENREMLDRFLAYYEESTGRRREMIAAMTGRVMAGLQSGRKKEVRSAQELGRAWLAQLQEETDMREEVLFDGELKYGFEDFDGEYEEFGEGLGEELDEESEGLEQEAEAESRDFR